MDDLSVRTKGQQSPPPMPRTFFALHCSDDGSPPNCKRSSMSTVMSQCKPPKEKTKKNGVAVVCACGGRPDGRPILHAHPATTQPLLCVSRALHIQ